MTLTLAIGAALTTLAVLCSDSALASEGEPSPEGRRVRITAAGFAGRPVIGHLIAIETTKVTVQREGSSEVVAIPRGEMARLEISTQKSRKGRGAGIGALVGFGVGAALGYAAGDDCGAPDAPIIVCVPREGSAAGVGLAVAGLGAVIGLLLSPGEKWETVDPAGLQISVMPSPGRNRGFGLTVSLTF